MHFVLYQNFCRISKCGLSVYLLYQLLLSSGLKASDDSDKVRRTVCSKTYEYYFSDPKVITIITTIIIRFVQHPSERRCGGCGKRCNNSSCISGSPSICDDIGVFDSEIVISAKQRAWLLASHACSKPSTPTVLRNHRSFPSYNPRFSSNLPPWIVLRSLMIR